MATVDPLGPNSEFERGTGPRVGRPRQVLLAALFVVVGLSAAQLATVGVSEGGGIGTETETCPTNGNGNGDGTSGDALAVAAVECEPKHKGGRGEHTGIGNEDGDDDGDDGDDDGDDQPPPAIEEFVPTIPSFPGLGPPLPLKNFNVVFTSGVVYYALPGSSQLQKLIDVEQLPFGSRIFAPNGSFRLIVNNGSGLETGVFANGIFTISQGPLNRVRSSQLNRRLITRLTLRGGRFAGCRRAARGRASAAARRSRRRVLRRGWSVSRGRFKTRGAYAAATVRGTVWLMQDRCDGTLIRVRRGSATIWDFTRQLRRVVRAGHEYFAPARR
jgi:hypothetical protein